MGLIVVLTLSSTYTYFNILKKKALGKLWKKVKLLKLSNFTFSHNVFYAIRILKSFNSHISVVVCSFFEFGMASKWRTREWVKKRRSARQILPLVTWLPLAFSLLTAEVSLARILLFPPSPYLFRQVFLVDC